MLLPLLGACSCVVSPGPARWAWRPAWGSAPQSSRYPILQSYIDVCLSGCLEHGEAFAREFIETTFLWSPFWLNERELARRPWVHEHQYVQIDRLLAAAVPDHFRERRLESEYAAITDDGHGGALAILHRTTGGGAHCH